MESISERIAYKCERCGHSWVARQQSVRKRECSRCRSTRVTFADKPNDSDVANSPPETKSEMSTSSPVAIPGSVTKDPEVYEKMKELQLVRLDKQIAEEKEGEVQTTVLEHLDSTFKILVLHLERRGALEADISTFFHSYCNWCGTSGINGTHYDNALGGWKCSKCGHISK